MLYSLPALQNEHNMLINWEPLKVNDWLVANRLSLNVNKTNNMIFHIHKKTSVTFPSTFFELWGNWKT